MELEERTEEALGFLNSTFIFNGDKRGEYHADINHESRTFRLRKGRFREFKKHPISASGFRGFYEGTTNVKISYEINSRNTLYCVKCYGENGYQIGKNIYL